MGSSSNGNNNSKLHNPFVSLFVLLVLFVTFLITMLAAQYIIPYGGLVAMVIGVVVAFHKNVFIMGLIKNVLAPIIDFDRETGGHIAEAITGEVSGNPLSHRCSRGMMIDPVDGVIFQSRRLR